MENSPYSLPTILPNSSVVTTRVRGRSVYICDIILRSVLSQVTVHSSQLTNPSSLVSDVIERNGSEEGRGNMPAYAKLNVPSYTPTMYGHLFSSRASFSL